MNGLLLCFVIYKLSNALHVLKINQEYHFIYHFVYI
jgi:hypothetical protein